jgi:hypothetical protein
MINIKYCGIVDKIYFIFMLLYNTINKQLNFKNIYAY